MPLSHDGLKKDTVAWLVRSFGVDQVDDEQAHTVGQSLWVAIAYAGVKSWLSATVIFRECGKIHELASLCYLTWIDGAVEHRPRVDAQVDVDGGENLGGARIASSSKLFHTSPHAV